MYANSTLLHRTQVFRCLVEGCQHKFRSAAERKQHLVDGHAFPPDFRLESMHLRQKRGQQRPQRALRAPIPQGAVGAATRGVEDREAASTGAALCLGCATRGSF